MSAGDVFELSAWHSACASLNVETNVQTWFAIEVIEQASTAELAAISWWCRSTS